MVSDTPVLVSHLYEKRIKKEKENAMHENVL
jgi:hypothetical protein